MSMMVPHLGHVQLLVLVIEAVIAVCVLQIPQAGWNLHATGLSIYLIV